MTKALLSAGFIAMLGGICSGQPATGAAKFEVASIKRYPPKVVVPPGSGGFKISPDGINASYTTLRMFVQWAYSVGGEISGPSWLDEERYDLAAKVSEPTALPQLKLMVQALLEERFQLILHKETKDFPVTALVVGKDGTKNLTPVEGDGKFELQRADGFLTLKMHPWPLPRTFWEALMVMRPWKG
jgi:uncharacterized protein (TIGR03435 family)